MVKKAKKKPVEVEFIQYKGTKNKKEVLKFIFLSIYELCTK